MTRKEAKSGYSLNAHSADFWLKRVGTNLPVWFLDIRITNAMAWAIYYAGEME